MPLPNLIVIGAMKCGTTSLHHYLARHPDVAMARDKELDFFVAGKNWDRGLAWYASRFPAGTRIRGESSSTYSAKEMYPGVPDRMHAIVPDARLVYMVRDPIERLVSQWVHLVAEGRERRPPGVALLDEAYLERSRYWEQVSAYLVHWPAARIHVIRMRDLAWNREATLRKAFEFLDLDPGVAGELAEIRLHRSARKRARTRAGRWIERSPLGRGVAALPNWLGWRVREHLYRPFSRPIPRPTLSARERAVLAERLRADADRFRAFTGRDFDGWSV